MQAKILVADDERYITLALKKHLEEEGHEIATAESGEDALRLFKAEVFDIVLLDLFLPGISGLETLQAMKALTKDIVVVIITAHGDIETAVSAIKSGAYDFVEKPFDLNKISIIIKKALETLTLKREIAYLKNEQIHKYSFENLVCRSKIMSEVVALASRVAVSETNTILIQGESGTGKSLLARAIHYSSPRASEPFVELTCTAIQETLIESELFGHEKGAFTDAKTAKKGLFEIADGGTIYLDEIGDIKPSTQAALLRVIEERTFKRVGGLKDISVNVRIIATTNKNLEEEVKKGRFRADLYFRLKVIPIHIPPLRERTEDIIPIVMHYIQTFNRDFRKNIHGISPAAERLLLNYPWHGNARELKNTIERICILADTEIIYPEHLPSEILMPAAASPYQHDMALHVHEAGNAIHQQVHQNGQAAVSREECISLNEVEKKAILHALQVSRGKQVQASKLLGIGRDALRYKMHKYGLL